MEYIRQTVSSAELSGIFNLPPSLLNKMVEVIILPAENNDIEERPKQKRQLGFAKGADVPDSFFEPLPEEDLQAWGL